jgi:hypothetical protein
MVLADSLPMALATLALMLVGPAVVALCLAYFLPRWRGWTGLAGLLIAVGFVVYGATGYTGELGHAGAAVILTVFAAFFLGIWLAAVAVGARLRWRRDRRRDPRRTAEIPAA